MLEPKTHEEAICLDAGAYQVGQQQAVAKFILRKVGIFVLVDCLQLAVRKWVQRVGFDNTITEPYLLLNFSSLAVQQSNFFRQVYVGRLETSKFFRILQVLLGIFAFVEIAQSYQTLLLIPIASHKFLEMMHFFLLIAFFPIDLCQFLVGLPVLRPGLKDLQPRLLLRVLQ